MLWNSVKDILEIVGYGIAAIERKLVIYDSNKTSNIPKPFEVANM